MTEWYSFDSESLLHYTVSTYLLDTNLDPYVLRTRVPGTEHDSNPQSRTGGWKKECSESGTPIDSPGETGPIHGDGKTCRISKS